MVLPRLAEPQVLLASFDRATVARAEAYTSDGRVTHVEVGRRTPSSVVAQADVVGSAARAYRVTIEAYEHDAERDGAHDGEVVVDSWCSCPVQLQCKHGVALCLALGTAARGAVVGSRVRPERPSWRSRLDDVLGGLASLEPPAQEPSPLALRLSVDAAGGATGPTVRLRPMRRGARGWVKSGADWRTVAALASERGHDRDQLEALLALHRSLGAHSWYAGTEPSLADFGPRVVRLLRDAQAAGLEVYAERPLTSLRLLPEPVPLVADLTAADGGTRLDLGLVVDGVLTPTAELLLLGSPVHAVARVLDDVLVLAALAEPLPVRTLLALGGREPLVVPGGEADDLGAYLQRLRRLVPLTSSDLSVELPEPVVPRLRVTVAWRDGSSADVSWTWVYRGAQERWCPTTSADDLGGVRDRAAERRALAAHQDIGPLAVVDRTVTGSDAVSLALLEVPEWRDREGVEVVEHDRPDFRRAQEPARITFDVVGPDAGETDPTATGEHDPGAPTDWLDLRVSVEVHGERVPVTEVLSALTLGQEFLVLPSGLYLPADAPELAALAAAVGAAAEVRERRAERRAHDAEERIRLGRHDLGLLADLADLGEVDTRAGDWVDRARALRDLVELPRPEPAGVTTELRSYQRDGFAWLAFLWEHSLGGVLADDMGLGKTLQVLALVAHTRHRGETAPFLVVAPTSVVGAWVEQAARHTPDLRVRAVTSTASRRARSIGDLADEADVLVTTYTLLRLEEEAYATVAWGGVVLDEAQQVKNHKSRAHQAVRSLRTPFALAVTGTPFENRLTELWALLAVVAPGLYPRLAPFAREVSRPVEAGDEVALDRFRQRIRPFMLRRTKQLVAADLPAKQEQVLAVELAPRHRRLYDAHLARERQRILGLLDDFAENQVAILAALTRLRQLALDPALVDPEHEDVGSAKLDVLLDHLTEVVAEGHRALVFSSFTGFLARLRDRLGAAGLEHVHLDGSTTDRAGVIERFRASEVPVFTISLKAGGVGLTLTEADYVYVLDPWWNPAAEAQAVDRAHRIGQDRTVMVYRLVSVDTIEDKVMALKARKAALFAQVVDGGGATDGAITAADVRALFE